MNLDSIVNICQCGDNFTFQISNHYATYFIDDGKIKVFLGESSDDDIIHYFKIRYPLEKLKIMVKDTIGR